MAAQIFRAAVDNDVGTEIERALQIRREESIVYDGELAMLFRDLGNCFDICDGKKRVCGCLDVDCLYIVVDRVLNSFKI